MMLLRHGSRGLFSKSFICIIAILVHSSHQAQVSQAVTGIKSGSSCKILWNEVVSNGDKYRCVSSGHEKKWIKFGSLKKEYKAEACSKPGKEKTLEGVKYRCVSSGGQKIWIKFGSIHKDASRESRELDSPKPVKVFSPGCANPEENPYEPCGVFGPFNESDPIYLKLQQLVNDRAQETSSRRHKVKVYFEPTDGDYGQYLNWLEESGIKSLEFYDSLGLSTSLAELNIVVGRSQDWLKRIVKENCGSRQLGDVASSVFVACPTGSGFWLASVTNFLGVSGWNYYITDDFKFSSTTLSLSKGLVVKAQVPHEFFHGVQHNLRVDKPTLDHLYFPYWLREGSAEVLATMALASDSSIGMSYAQLKNERWKTAPKHLLSMCSSPLQKAELTPLTTCQYFQGMIPVELLISKYGGVKVITKLFADSTGEGFDNDFKRIVGVDLLDFYAESDALGRTFGFLATP